jgi:uncharacterized protein (DUF885 family)
MENPLQQRADKIFQAIAEQFPVCCASDEFYFFPQVVHEAVERWDWDDFSTPGVAAFAARSRQWQAELSALERQGLPEDDRVDTVLLQQMLQTLREQLLEVAPQRRQPTFSLNIVVAGLTEALESDDPAAWNSRISGLSEFLRRATTILDQVPEHFRSLGLQMLADLEQWFLQLHASGHAIADGLSALRDFAKALKHARQDGTYLLTESIFERLVVEHLGAADALDTIESELRREYAEMNEVLQEEAGRLAPGAAWQSLEAHIPFCAAPRNDLRELYRPELTRLEEHVRQAGLVPELAGNLRPELAAVPASMTAIRASDAYSARVGHPSRGGIFYLYQETRKGSGQVGRTLEYRMTAAHEAWPGHHLLDVCRWNLPRAIRRPLESPLCYEGWACFAETLLAETGYFDGPWDRFLLARRRIERAARGLIDIGLQTGRMTFAAAAEVLVDTGYTPRIAADVIPKYVLRPGYQVCYTLGLKRMISLREQCRQLDAGAFARRLLGQGEIGFVALQKVVPGQGD